MRANAEQLPFADGVIDGVLCGGSLNEFRAAWPALAEARRVASPTARQGVPTRRIHGFDGFNPSRFSSRSGTKKPAHSASRKNRRESTGWTESALLRVPFG